MYEPWALLADLSTASPNFESDPNHPLVEALGVRPHKEERTGWAMLFIIQMFNICIWALFAHYLNNTTNDGLLFQTSICCLC